MIQVYILRAIAMLFIIPAHEAAHAFVSYRLGDPTAKNYGRMTLNPMAHFDPWGALCMIVAGFGWAKPVPADVRRFKNPKRDMAISAAAGPLCNLLLAYIAMILFKLSLNLLIYLELGANPKAEVATAVSYFTMFFSVFIQLNLSLAIFNLIPIPPFDGSRILLLFLPQKLYFGVMKYERYLALLILVLVFTNVLDMPLSAINNGVYKLFDIATSFVPGIASRLTV